MNSTWIFTGVVNPEYERVTIPAMRISSTDRYGARQTTIFYKVEEGLVVGTVVIPPEYDPSDIPSVVRQAVQQRVDLEGFVRGGAYDFRVRTIAPVDHIDRLETSRFLSSALVDPDDVSRRAALVHQLGSCPPLQNASVVVRSAMADLRLAVLEPSHAPYFTYRVAESLRQHFVCDGEDRSASWDRMHSELGTSKNDLDVLAAIAVRHGEVMDINVELGQRILKTASRFIENFIAYLLRSSDQDFR